MRKEESLVLAINPNPGFCVVGDKEDLKKLAERLIYLEIGFSFMEHPFYGDLRIIPRCSEDIINQIKNGEL